MVDWLEAIVALPDQLFYNTGISTYLWILSNRKAKPRRGKIQLIDDWLQHALLGIASMSTKTVQVAQTGHKAIAQGNALGSGRRKSPQP